MEPEWSPLSYFPPPPPKERGSFSNEVNFILVFLVQCDVLFLVVGPLVTLLVMPILLNSSVEVGWGPPSFGFFSVGKHTHMFNQVTVSRFPATL